MFLLNQQTIKPWITVNGSPAQALTTPQPKRTTNLSTGFVSR
ncbi:MAG: hypothetical protein AW09_001591 [Candidatus Accumulibacter phosphatis]|uniref:Uncharacterized protein n=1 Tax=Candidatus Accumulibacter phosphatis TaxID=327160 RepID=A0A080LWM1_9PROT|nr:MAG: hypothetical protein AW09_001591 [Candidatus Accumulibacter phosphatis]